MTVMLRPAFAAGSVLMLLLGQSASAGLPFAPAGAGSFQVSPDPPPVYDVTGSYVQTGDGVSISFTLAQDANGIVTGFGQLQIDGTTGSVPFTIRGVVRGVNGVARLILKSRGSGLISDGIESILVFFFSSVRAQVVEGPPRMISGTSHSRLCARGLGCDTAVGDFNFPLPDDGAWTIILSPLVQTGRSITGQATVATDAPRSLSYGVRGRVLRDGTLLLLLRPLLPRQGRPFVLRILATLEEGQPPIPTELLFVKGGFLGQVVNARY